MSSPHDSALIQACIAGDAATWRELVEKGVTFTQEPQEADWGTAAIFTDPDGNQFVLSSP